MDFFKVEGIMSEFRKIRIFFMTCHLLHKFRPKTNVPSTSLLSCCFVSPYLNGFCLTKFENYHF